MSRDNNWHDMTLGASRSSRGFRRRMRQVHDILCGKKDAKIVVERGTTAIKALEG